MKDVLSNIKNGPGPMDQVGPLTQEWFREHDEKIFQIGYEAAVANWSTE